MAYKFEVYKDRTGETRFRFRASNGEILFSSEAYQSKLAAARAIESIKANASAAGLQYVDTGTTIGGFQAGIAPKYVPMPHVSGQLTDIEEDEDRNEVIARIRLWTADEKEALSWYRSYPIAELGNVTPRALVETGRADALHRYLDHIAEGGYA